MEKEQNSTALRRAIEALPSYQPSEGLWESIEQELDMEAEQSEQLPVPRLPDHHPPTFVWRNIEQALDHVEAEEGHIPLRSKLRWKNAVRTAAVALLLITAWLVLKERSKEKISYTATTVEAIPILVSTHEDEPMIRMVRQAFEESPLARQQQQFESLINELKELDQAREYLLNTMNQYGHDVQMIKELAEIERARTDVVMKMSRFI